MTPELAKALVDGLFAELEKRFAAKPLLVIAIHAAHVAADDVLPAVLAKVLPEKS